MNGNHDSAERNLLSDTVVNILPPIPFIESNLVRIGKYLEINENEKFWDDEKHQKVMDFYAEYSHADVKEIFSFLMFDWYDQNVESSRSYFLLKKFGNIITKYYRKSDGTELLEKIDDSEMFKRKVYEFSRRELFLKLLNVLCNSDMKQLYYYCLKIIYYFFYEAIKEKDKDKNKVTVEFEFDDIKILIEKALEIGNYFYKIHVLKVLFMSLKNTKNDDYTLLKNKVLNAVKPLANDDKTPSKSLCEISYEFAISHCEYHFFKLAALLKESQIIKLKTEFKKYKELHKKYFGEFWTVAIRLNTQLLYQMAVNKNLTETQQFLLIRKDSEDPEIKSSITNYFKKTSEFFNIFSAGLDTESLQILKSLIEKQEFEKITDTPHTRRLLFGRENTSSKSIFEKFIVGDEKFEIDVIENFNTFFLHIWKEFQLWDNPELLILKNYEQKSIMDYIFESENEFLIIKFLSLDSQVDEKENRKPFRYMMLKNLLYNSYAEPSENMQKSFIEYHLSLTDSVSRNDTENLQNFFYLIEELSQFCSHDSFEEFFKKIFKNIITEKSQEFDKRNEPKLIGKHFILSFLMIYWNYYVEFKELVNDTKTEKQEDNSEQSQEKNNKKFQVYLYNTKDPKKELLDLKDIQNIPFFHILSLIIQKKSQDFEETFEIEMEKMEESFASVYELDRNYNNFHQEANKKEIFHFYEKFFSTLSFVLLFAALKTNQEKIMKKVFEFSNFLLSDPEFPLNMKVEDIHKSAVLMFLEKRYELGRGVLPKEWISYETLKKFLDSKITNENGFWKIGCQFMLPYYNYGIIPNSPEELNDDFYMNEDYDTMEYILNDDNLKSLISHPVMEIITRIKIQKYLYIMFGNLSIFLIFFMAPILICIYKFNSGSEKDILFDLAIVVSLFGLAFMIFRELFQLKVHFEGKFKEYIKKTSNIIELPMIILSFILIILIWYGSTDNIATVTLEVFVLILLILATTTLLPIFKFAIYMNCFGKLFKMYLNVFIIFIPLFIGFAALIFIVFHADFGGVIEDFHGFETAFMKYIIMFSGEIGIDPKEVKGFIQGAMITLVIILIINKSNLILSIVINDMEDIMKESKEFELRKNAKKYVKWAKHIRIFYSTKIENANKEKLIDQLLYRLIKFLLNKNTFVQQLQTVYINQKTKSVYADLNKLPNEFNVSKSQCIRKTSDWAIKREIFDWFSYLSGYFIIDDEIEKNIRKILSKREEKIKCECHFDED